ncbi:MAG: cation diffusion facilitator family transporter [Candidatus Omnitrophica bacterium]|nr:cation diffusion facilitator family transporter [Candidatus Omnitrophota bacterium]
MTVDVKKHYSRIKLLLIVILILNWGVAIAKMVLGLATRCQSMTADGLHSLSDGASNIIGLVGIALSSKPVDQDHPYGHRKYETFFSLGIAALLFLVAINLVREGIDRIWHPAATEVSSLSFVVMVVTMVINTLVMKYEYSQGKKLRSDFLVADSMHTKADIFTSFSVIVALLGIKLGFQIIDPITTLVISIFIAHAGLEIIKDASKVLCDTVAIIDIAKISDIVMTVKGVRQCHKIRTRGRPDDIWIDLHVQVDPEMHIDQAHKICYAVEEAIKNKIPEASDVLVHIEPRGDRKS